MNILQINGSPRGGDAFSTQLADAIRAQIINENQTGQQDNLTVKVVDLGETPVPAAENPYINARDKAADERSEAEQAIMAPYDAALEDVQNADIIILGMPMYNFNISSQIKNWMDAVARAGITFEYTSEGPKGLLDDKQVFVAHARGGKYAGTENDHMTPYLNQFLGFLGLDNVTHLYVEGVAMGEDQIQSEWSTIQSAFDQGLTASGRARNIDLYPS